jgi:hypothetical protein
MGISSPSVQPDRSAGSRLAESRQSSSAARPEYFSLPFAESKSIYQALDQIDIRLGHIKELEANIIKGRDDIVIK